MVMKKENFIKEISKLSNEEINRIILEKGKEPKLISPIYVVNKK